MLFGGRCTTPVFCNGPYTGAVVTKSSSEIDFRGDLQAEVMTAVWKLGEATVEDVRAEQPKRRRSAYNTVQTVLNRLVERGLLARQRKGRAFVYKPKVEESEYLARSIGERLAGASPAARRAALVNLVGDLEPGELDEIARRASQIKRSRETG
jgi:predicted transcriptional regulator